jgi:hypothetical protein
MLLFTTTKRIALSENAEHIVTSDSHGKSLSGDRNYKLHLPPGIPACNFWSVIVYDSQTRLIIKTDQPWPSVYSSCKRLAVNHDGSVDVWFGPKASPGKENNWIQTIPGKVWYMILRLYEPQEAWLNRTWQPGKIEQL